MGRKPSALGTSIVKTFRMQTDLVGKVEILKKVKHATSQKIITDAVEAYVAANLGEATESLEKIDNIQSNIDINEYILVPISYYASFNDLAVIEVKSQIKRGQLKSINLGDNTLVLIDINEGFYKKAELLVIKGNVSNVVKELHALKRKVNILEKKISGGKVEEE